VINIRVTDNKKSGAEKKESSAKERKGATHEAKYYLSSYRGEHSQHDVQG